MHAEGQERDPIAVARAGSQAHRMGVFPRDQGRSPRIKAQEDFCLGVSNTGLIGKMLNMDGGNHRDGGNMGTHLRRQARNLPAMVHANLKHAKPGVGGHACQSQGYTPMIIVGFD